MGVYGFTGAGGASLGLPARPAPGPSSRTRRRASRPGNYARPWVSHAFPAIARELGDSLSGLTGWAERHRSDIAAARAAYDRSKEAAASAR